MTILLILVGLVLLAIGGDILVRGAIGVSSRLGVSPLLAGLTIVGFGTSTPELVTSLFAAFDGAPGRVCGMHDATVRMTAFARQMVAAVLVVGERDTLVEQPADVLGALLYDVTHHRFVAQVGTRIEGVGASPFARAGKMRPETPVATRAPAAARSVRRVCEAAVILAVPPICVVAG